jgi:hypothetical protein
MRSFDYEGTILRLLLSEMERFSKPSAFLLVGEKNVLFWYARTPKSPPLNPLFLALPRSKINTTFR